MKFSIVIPSYGQEKYLFTAIESALNQKFPTEVIIVDDGSTDRSYEIAESFGNRVKIIKQVNKGLASARNTGIMNAIGEYMFFLDADDIMMEDCLRKVADKISETGADVVAPSIRCFDENGGVNDTIIHPNPTLDDFKEGNRLPYCCAIKRSVLLEVGGYSPRMDMLGGYEDLHLWYDLMSRGKKIVTIQESLVMYRIKENSMYTDAKKNHEKLWAQIIKDFPETASHYKAI